MRNEKEKLNLFHLKEIDQFKVLYYFIMINIEYIVKFGKIYIRSNQVA
jgi:hypothetical protein